MFRKLQPVLLSIFLCLALAGSAMAESRGFGTRALGMGGAFTAVADDGTAAGWNPAGLSQVRAFSFTSSLGLQGDWREALDVYRLVREDRRPVFNDTAAVCGGIFGLNLKGIGVNAAALSELTATQNTVSTAADGAVGVTGSLTLAQEVTSFLALGTNIKLLREERFRFRMDSAAPGDPALNYREETKAQGLAADIGALFKLGKTVRAGAVLRNLGPDLDFSGTRKDYVNQGEEAASFSEKLPTSLAAGVAVEPVIRGLLVAGDVEHFMDSGKNRVHVGVEQSVSGALKLRAGLSRSDASRQLDYSAGAGFQVGPALLNLAALGNNNDGWNAVYLSAGFQW